MNTQDRRLIEDYLPIQAISAETAVGAFKVRRREGGGVGRMIGHLRLRHDSVRIMAWLRQTMAPMHPQYTLCGSTAKVWHPADHGLASPDHGTHAPAIHTLQLRRQSVAPGGSWPGFARPWHPAACVSAGSEISCARKSTIKLGGKPARNAEREVRSEQQQRNSRRDPSLRSG